MLVISDMGANEAPLIVLYSSINSTDSAAMITQIGNREVNLIYEMENGEHFALE